MALRICLEKSTLSQAALKGPHIQVWTLGGFWTLSRSSSKHKTSLQVPCQVNALNYLVHVGSGSSQMPEPQRRFFVLFMIVQVVTKRVNTCKLFGNSIPLQGRHEQYMAINPSKGNTWLFFIPSKSHFHPIIFGLGMVLLQSFISI